MRRSIIAAVDGSAVATEAARLAASLARGLDRRLVLAHVTADPPVFPYGDRWVRAARQRRATERATELLKSVAAEIDEPTARRRIVFSGAVQGSLEDRLAALSREEDSDLLVLGSRARSPLARAVLGSVSASLASRATCAIVVVPDGARRTNPRAPAGPIVCGIDRTVESTRARVMAARLADRLGLVMIPVHIEQTGPTSDGPQRQAEGGEPSAALAGVASSLGARLVVVGHRGRKTGLGAVSRNLAAEAEAPVLIVPPAARLPHFAAPGLSVELASAA
jgi:nucleotide-binding universal stress UspA family protein